MGRGTFAILLLMLAGCTPSGIRTVTAPKPITQSSGNGDSYSGKTFVFKDAQGACPSDIDSAILYNFDGQFFLTRQNCQDLNPFIEIPGSDVSLNFAIGQLTYEGETYSTEFNPSCNYPEYTGQIGMGGECSSTAPVQAMVSSNQVADGVRFEFAMYNASNATHSYSNRHITYQRVELSQGLGADSVDLILSSYEPVRWEFAGNVAAIRSVHIRGYYCALYTGVDSSRVSISTYEQGDSPNVLSLPLSLNLGFSSSSYEGSCLANRTLLIP